MSSEPRHFTQRLVVDAGVVLKCYLPEEGSAQAQAIFRDRALGKVELLAPALLSYELSNALLVAVRRQRLAQARAEEILDELVHLRLTLHGPEGLEEQCWALAGEYQRSANDAAYLALAQHNGARLVTGDRRLYNALKDNLSWVLWVEDYPSS